MSLEPRIKSFEVGNRASSQKLSYTEWRSEKSGMPIVCVHGLTRNGRDFDQIAQYLSTISSVYCPDVAGRGDSDWLSDYKDYDFPLYISDMIEFLTEIDVKDIVWIGTSMGGIIGMLLASMPNTPISALVLNDVGSTIPKQSLQHIGSYVGTNTTFPTLEEGKKYLIETHSEFAPMSDNDWDELAKFSLEQIKGGKFQLKYDPKIGQKMREGDLTNDVNLEPVWNLIKCPVLIIRGSNSKLLPRYIVESMQQSKPNVSTFIVEGAGHAPSLNGLEEQEIIKNWILSNQ